MAAGEVMNPTGSVRVTYVAREGDTWHEVSTIEDLVSRQARAWLKKKRMLAMPAGDLRQNLVVRQGRAAAARSLRQGYTRHIAALQLGDCIKSAHPPSLLDSGVISEIQTLAGVPQATFAIDNATEVFEPGLAQRYPADVSDLWGGPGAVAISGGGTTTLTTTAVDLTTLSIQFGDIVVFNTPTATPVALAVRRVISATQLELHNPYGYASTSVEFRIESSNSQIIFSKLITASSHFPAATYGPAVLVHESAWLLNDGMCWNRVLYNAQDDNSGVLIQPADAFSTEIGVRFELTVTF